MNKVLSKIFIFSLAAFLISSPGLTRGNAAQQPEAELLQQVKLKVWGLKCETCIPNVRKPLQKISGVREVKITRFDKAGTITIVEVSPGSVTGDQLVAALREVAFNAEVIAVGEPRKVVLPPDSGFGFLDFLR
ncbi:MAG: heavy-metal-associated domain-containing protein [Nitrospinales bacterium]